MKAIGIMVFGIIFVLVVTSAIMWYDVTHYLH